MRTSRRDLLVNSSAVALGFAGLRAMSGRGPAAFGADEKGSAKPPAKEADQPPPDPAEKMFDVPEGFSCTVVSRFGERMDDGLRTPGMADGMAAFPAPDGRVLLVRNHELDATQKAYGPYGDDNRLLRRLDPALLYDAGERGRYPSLGGTTNILYDPRARRTEAVFLSLAGTSRNCAGGVTPWGTWITCEETVQQPDGEYAKDHGYNFEVPAKATGGPFDAVPIKAMGRFNHEAVCVDPKTGIIYQTEDRPDSLVYRFIPSKPGVLLDGGRLQALRVRGQKSFDTRNWYTPAVAVGQALDVEWVDVGDVEAPDDDLRYAGFYVQGCARFARGEGMWHGSDGVYFAATTGGPARRGQVWRYVPSPAEGTAEEANSPGRLELFIEPNDHNLCENCDNITFAPWGDLYLCEDQALKRSTPEQYVLRVTPKGEVSRFARNALNRSELAGICFSPDGGTLFVNIYNPGVTVAITGPWREGNAVLG